MRNRAKCKLCQSIIESFHHYDYVSCKCGEIAIDGGTHKYQTYAKDFSNFLRVDDEGHEIVVMVKEKIDDPDRSGEVPKMSKKEKIEMLEAMIKNLEQLPQNAMSLPISHYDLYSFMLLISSIFKED